MAPRTTRAVNPLVPLMLLQAVRDADRPDGAAEAEYAPELLNKRLGTTETIYAQIRRYTDAVRRGRSVSTAEVAALARLIARRPDAPAVFGAAGQATAQAAYWRMSSPRRTLIRLLPRAAARPLARRAARRLAARYFGAVLEPDGGRLRTVTPRDAALAIPTGADSPDAPGHAFYDEGVRELLELLALV